MRRQTGQTGRSGTHRGRRTGTQWDAAGANGGEEQEEEQDKSVPPALATPESCLTPTQLRARVHGTNTEHDFPVWGED